MLLEIAAQFRRSVHHLDVKPAFLNENLNEDIYVLQHEGYIKLGDELKV